MEGQVSKYEGEMSDTRPCEAHIISPLPTHQSVHISSISPHVSSPQSSTIAVYFPASHALTKAWVSCFDSTLLIGEMAQRTEKEETEFKVPETISLCVNNCGLTGNPATNNMCQKCFNATATSTTAAASAPSLKFTGEKSPRSLASRSPQRSNSPGLGGVSTKKTTDLPKPEESARREVNRCNGCRKRVGLTGFRCRCGDLFCSEHRYSDRHDCSYDYKAAGRETIARENPVVRAAKIVRV